MLNTTFQHLGASYSLTIVPCDLEKLIFEVRVGSPLLWYHNCPKELFYENKNSLLWYKILLVREIEFLFLSEFES